MSKGRSGWHHVLAGLGVGAPLLALGCDGESALVGAEGDTINLGRCFGADCGVSVQATEGTSSEAEPCGEVQGTLQDMFRFEPIEGVTLRSLRISPDGSLWGLGTTEPRIPDRPPAPVLVHYSADGELLGANAALKAEGDNSSHTEQSLAIDPAGTATVVVYSIYAATADSELIERLNVSSFDADFNPVGEPLAFRGMAAAHVATPSVGTLLLAGNALNNAPHGVLARITAGEPDWIQTGVPASGSQTTGVSGVVVAEDGTVTVLTQRTPRWDGSLGSYDYKYGLVNFDVNGKLLSDVKLPTDYEDGFLAAIELLPDGDFVVAGVTESSQTMLRRVSRQGELGWAFEIDGARWPYLAVDPETGRSFTATAEGLAVIDADGVSCQRLALPPDPEYPDWPQMAQEHQVRGDYVYLMANSGLRRYRLPSDAAPQAAGEQ